MQSQIRPRSTKTNLLAAFACQHYSFNPLFLMRVQFLQFSSFKSAKRMNKNWILVHFHFISTKKNWVHKCVLHVRSTGLPVKLVKAICQPILLFAEVNCISCTAIHFFNCALASCSVGHCSGWLSHGWGLPHHPYRIQNITSTVQYGGAAADAPSFHSIFCGTLGPHQT